MSDGDNGNLIKEINCSNTIGNDIANNQLKINITPIITINTPIFLLIPFFSIKFTKGLKI